MENFTCDQCLHCLKGLENSLYCDLYFSDESMIDSRNGILMHTNKTCSFFEEEKHYSVFGANAYNPYLPKIKLD